MSFGDLVEKYKDKPEEPIWVYSFDGKRIVPGLAYFPRKTGTKKVIEIELDNGQKVKCTPDHKWMLRDGSWKMAKELVPGKSLMPLYTRINHKVVAVRHLGEEEVYDISVEKYHNFALAAGVIVHNSVGLLQSMRHQGYLTKVVSVETAGGPYEVLKQSLYENRIQMYNYPPLNKELRELQKDWKTGKVDHSATGSKDVSDALASIVATLTETASMTTDAPITKRASDAIVMDDEDQWILGDMIAIKPEEISESEAWRQSAAEFLAGQNVNSQPDWRTHAEKAMEQQSDSQYDWKKNFQMPFGTG
jgi:hypothetical protein